MSERSFQTPVDLRAVIAGRDDDAHAQQLTDFEPHAVDARRIGQRFDLTDFAAPLERGVERAHGRFARVRLDVRRRGGRCRVDAPVIEDARDVDDTVGALAQS